MATSNVPNLHENLDFIFECFIETLCSTHTAVSIDTDAQQKLEFKLYLVIQLFNSIIQFKIEYLKNMNKNQYVIKFLHQVVVEKKNNKLKHYISVSDFHGILDDEL